jgi:hypothetical protein
MKHGLHFKLMIKLCSHITVREFDRLGNTHNPMFNYEWKMVERNIAENLK